MELTIDQALQMAIEAHKAGRTQEADRIYTAIIKVQPKHPDANHNMGVLGVELGKVDQALPFFKIALEANSSIKQFWLSYIDALIKLNKFAEASSSLKIAEANGVTGSELANFKEVLNRANLNGTKIKDPPQYKLQSIIKLHKNGQYQEALVLTKKILKSYPQSAILLSIKGAINADQGLFSDSIRNYKRALEINPKCADIYNNMGVAYKLNGCLKKATENYKKAIEIQPYHADAYSNLGSVLGQKGELEEAIKFCTKAINIEAKHADAHHNLGLALTQIGDLKKAIKSYEQAVKLKPDFSDAYNSMGFYFYELGQFDTAIEKFKKALKFKPLYVDAHNNLGNALKGKGDITSSINSYKKAIEIQPNNANSYNNLGAAIETTGDTELAINYYMKAIKIEPNNALFLKNIANALKGVIFIRADPYVLSVIVAIINKKSLIRPKDICGVAISLLKLEPTVKTVFEAHGSGLLKSTLKKLLIELSELPLLLKLMSVCPIADLAFEDIFTNIRAELLYSVSDIIASPNILRFQSALAMQCFTNEYIYIHSDVESKALRTLEDNVKKQLFSGKKPTSQSIFCLASYKALHEYEWCDLLTGNKEIGEVFKQQVLEPKQENLLKNQVPFLKKISDQTSSKVREQYETNPYPRWVNLDLEVAPNNIRKIVKDANLKLIDNKILELKDPEILVAGCGTGQHSIATAARFKNSKVLAIDLSLSSLAYAERKTKELGLRNIEYMQADILDLKMLGKHFDIIESGGVLHHMSEPMVGWKVLNDCLKPGGLMMIGLYSELARKHILRTRREIKESNLGSSEAAIKYFRRTLIESDKEHHKKILSSYDFYSLSTVRDLLFHVQEKRFTVSQIKDCLAELSLEFCGFLENPIVQKFKLAYFGKDDPYDLEKWRVFENDHPDTFAGMYQFWCQKNSTQGPCQPVNPNNDQA